MRRMGEVRVSMVSTSYLSCEVLKLPSHCTPTTKLIHSICVSRAMSPCSIERAQMRTKGFVSQALKILFPRVISVAGSLLNFLALNDGARGNGVDSWHRY